MYSPHVGARRRAGKSPILAADARGARICNVVIGPDVCNVRVWNDAEWDSLGEASRPAGCVRVPGLGWVGAVRLLRVAV